MIFFAVGIDTYTNNFVVENKNLLPPWYTRSVLNIDHYSLIICNILHANIRYCSSVFT